MESTPSSAIAVARSVPDLIHLLQLMTDDVIELTPDEMTELGLFFRDKVDELKRILDTLKKSKELWDEEKDRYAAASKQAKRIHDALKQHVIGAMRIAGLKVLPGVHEQATLTIIHDNRTETYCDPPGLEESVEKLMLADVPLNLDPLYADFISAKIVLDWKKDDIKDFIKKNPEDRRFDGKAKLFDTEKLEFKIANPVRRLAQKGEITDTAFVVRGEK